MVDRLDGLWHNTIIRRNDEYRDIRNLCAACTHCSKRLMARRIEEHDFLPIANDLVGTDVLRNTARLMRTDRGIANRIEQRCLAVVHMPHNSDNRGTFFE